MFDIKIVCNGFSNSLRKNWLSMFDLLHFSWIFFSFYNPVFSHSFSDSEMAFDFPQSPKSAAESSRPGSTVVMVEPGAHDILSIGKSKVGSILWMFN